MTIDTLMAKDGKGFTLIEVMIASVSVTLFCLTMFGGYLGISALNKYLNRPSVERANVRDGPEAELFMDRDGKRFYAEIDGKPLDQYKIVEKE